MKRNVTTFISALAVLWAFSMAQAAPQYVGGSKCKTCHKMEKYGNQQEVWNNSRHAQAYETLATDKAKEAAKKQGIDDPQQSEKCLRCHVTAYDLPAESKAATYKAEEGVTCEACHGPGSDYKKMKVMKDHDASIAAGMIVPDEKTCKKCHTPEDNEFYKEFDYETYFAKIAHPGPAKK